MPTGEPKIGFHQIPAAPETAADIEVIIPLEDFVGQGIGLEGGCHWRRGGRDPTRARGEGGKLGKLRERLPIGGSGSLDLGLAVGAALDEPLLDLFGRDRAIFETVCSDDLVHTG